PPPTSTLFPYTTLFRSQILGQLGGRCHRLRGQPEALDEESDDPMGGDRVVHYACPPVLRSLSRNHASSLLRTRLALTPPKPKERSEEHTSELQSRSDLV